MKKFNRAVWLKDLRATESQISAIKKLIHQPHTIGTSKLYPWSYSFGLVNGPTGPVRVDHLVHKLQQLTATATALYALRRQVKGKAHPINQGWGWREYTYADSKTSRWVAPLTSYTLPFTPERERELNKQILEHFDTSKYFDEVLGAEPIEQLVGDAKEPVPAP